MSELVVNSEYMDFIDHCELLMQQAPIDLPVEHKFTPGIYIREIFIPKGVILSSKVHLTEHPYIVSSGVINIIDGETVMQVQAPYTGINKAGTRRLGYAIEDTIWSAIFPNDDDCRDLAILEQRLFAEYKNPLITQHMEEITQ